MRKMGNGGVIINVSSMGGLFDQPYAPVYAATKVNFFFHIPPKCPLLNA